MAVRNRITYIKRDGKYFRVDETLGDDLNDNNRTGISFERNEEQIDDIQDERVALTARKDRYQAEATKLAQLIRQIDDLPT